MQVLVGLVDLTQPGPQRLLAAEPLPLGLLDLAAQIVGGVRAQISLGLVVDTGGEQLQESLRQFLALRNGQLHQVDQVARRPEQTGRLVRQRPQHDAISTHQTSGGRKVQQVRQVLAAQDLDSRQMTARRHDRARDQILGPLQEIQVAAPPVGDGQQERIARTASRSPDLLGIAGRATRQRGQHDRRQVTDVDAHLQRRGARQDVGVLETLPALECLLHVLPLGTESIPVCSAVTT